MAIRDWSGRRIAALWITWAALLVIAIWLGRDAPDVRPVLPAPVTWRPAISPGDIHDLGDSQAVLFYSVLTLSAESTGPDSVRRIALMGLLSDSVASHRDSVWRALQLPSTLTVAQRDSLPALMLATIGPPLTKLATHIAEDLEAAMPYLWLRFIGILVLYATPPIILGIVTLRWYIPRVVAQATAGRAP